MAWILNALNSVQDAVYSSTPAPKAACEIVLPELKKLNDSVYELCKPLVPRVGRPSVEIVFFHGLQFDGSDTTYLTTWLSKDGQETWLLWIFEFFPEARILLISYNGCVKQKVDAGCTDMYITSENLWQDIIDENAQVGQDGCPVVLVGHSLGGLVIKEVLMKANSMLNSNGQGKKKEKLGFLLQNVKQLFYYSCPNNGTRLADMQTKFLKGLLFDHLTTLNKEAARCNEAFRLLRQNSKWEAYSIVEALPTELGPLGRHIVVEEASARYDTDGCYTIHADHVNVCRPESPIDASFSKLKDVINQAVGADVKGHKVSVSQHEVVGLDDQVKVVRKQLENYRQVGLFGPGGTGKTTLAKLVYDGMSDDFEYTCFIQEVKEKVTRNASLKDLQAEILKNLYYKGRQVVVEWSRLEGKKVLVVLDDVKYESQVLVETEFSAQSCVLLTSRDQRLLRGKDFEIHLVELLDDPASKRLFCYHAFKTASAPAAFEDKVQRFTQKCRGWPLVLEVAGKYLYKQEEGRVWDDAFDKLSQAKPLKGKIDEDEFWPIFTVIYDSFAPEEQQMFLDVAICFHGEDLVSVKRAWRVWTKFSAAGWQNLLDTGLITTIQGTWQEGLKIQMHEVLRDLGRSIACPDPGNIQGHSHVCYQIETGPWPFEQGNPEVKLLKIVSNGGKLYPGQDPSPTIDIRKFRGLQKLKALWLDGVRLHGSCNLLPARLVFLKVKECDSWDRLTFVSSRWEVSGAELFEAVSRKANELRAGFFQPHPILRHLEIERARDVSPLQDILRQLKNLEYLSFGDINGYRTRTIPNSLGQLSALKCLTLRNCEELRALPSTLGQLSALQCLTVSSCRKLIALPSTLGGLKDLRRLVVKSCRSLAALPETLGQLYGLEHLEITDCYFLESVPDALWRLPALEHLEITGSRRLSALPPTLVELRALRRFKIEWCHGLEAVRDMLGTLPPLQLQHLTVVSKALPRTFIEILGQVDSVKHLNIWIGNDRHETFQLLDWKIPDVITLVRQT